MRKNWKKWGKNVTAVVISLLLSVNILGETQMVGAATTDTIINEQSKIYLKATTLAMAPATTYTLELTGATGNVTWSSANKKIATVDAHGKITAKEKGTTAIQAEYNGETYTCQLSVIYATYETADNMKYTDVKGNFGYTGRWFKKKINGKKYVFTNTDGSAIYFKTTGTKYVNINFLSRVSVATPYFSYSIDGKAMKRQRITSQKINLGNKKTHYVRVLIDSMAEFEDRWRGEAGVGIKSVTPVTKTGVVTAIEPKNEMIAFYGDSITQGVRALSMALSPSGTSTTHSYAWYCAEKLNMVPYYAGYGASGLTLEGSYTTLSNAITNFSASRKAAQIEPSIVVIEHGTNDVNASAPEFTAAYKKALLQLHKKYPDAKIVAMIPFTGLHAAEIRNAASSYKWCTVVETSSWNISYTDGLHPNSKGAKVIGTKLAAKIKKIKK